MKDAPEMDLIDETLSAYLDGELDAAARAAVEAGLARDAGARERLARLKAADAALRAAFPLQHRAAGEDPLAAMILAHRAPTTAQTGTPNTARNLGSTAAPSSVVTPISRSAPRRRLRREWLFAMAAGFTAIGVGLVVLAPRDEAGRPDAALVATLDGQASGEVGADGTRPMLSFRAGDGRWCRVFERDDREGLACRDEGGWQLMAEIARDGAGELRLAGSSPAIDAMMDRLGGDPALDPAQERAQIQQHWRPSR